MHKYQEIMETFHLPERVEEKVLASAGCMGQRKCTGMVFLRRAVCAACALALVLGSFSVRWEQPPAAGSSEGTASTGKLVLSYEFGLQASAAERSVNGGMIFLWEDNCGSFRITGEDIAAIRLETDKGILLRNGEERGSLIAEAFEENVDYAIAPTEGSTLETLNGAVLSLTAIFTDGSERTTSHRLTAENLRTFQNEDGREVLAPALEGDPCEKIAALYAEGESSRWLLWPVAGSNTVSLSMPYGSRSIAGSAAKFHSGIDIPGTRGSEITAAAGGAVAESGYDAARGNYLVLDHGGGLTTLYSHCQELLAAEGNKIEAGQVIALLGSTGMATGPHLHFEVRQDGEAQNPVAYFTSEIRATLQAE